MQNLWSDADAEALVAAYAKKGVARDLALRIYTTRLLGGEPRLVLHGGGHLPPLEAGSAWLPGVEAETEAFLDAYVAGDGTVARVVAAATAGGAGASLFSLTSG